MLMSRLPVSVGNQSTATAGSLMKVRMISMKIHRKMLILFPIFNFFPNDLHQLPPPDDVDYR